jgi:U1 small nuclear ribonucleoprotein C
MPKYFCDYCDVYLTHDSMSVRKAHNSGRNHLRNVVDYYQQIGQEKAQSVIDSITASYNAEGQGASNPMAGVPPPGMGFPGAAPPGFGPPGGMPPGEHNILKEARVRALIVIRHAPDALRSRNATTPSR